MARIRSIKPDVWTDPEFVACSPLARLLWIGSWNQADDFGVLKDDPEKLKLQILPNETCDPHALVAELVEQNLLLRRLTPDGTPVLVVRTFCVHQKIDHRATGRWGHPDNFTVPASPPKPRPSPPDPDQSRHDPPDPPESQPSPTIRTEGNGEEGKGKTARSSLPAPLTLVPEVSPPSATGRVETVFNAWREATGKQRARLDPKRRSRIEQALRDYPLDDVVDAVRGWRNSPHHCGQNDRSTVYNSIDLLLRDAEHIEKFRDYERRGGTFRPATQPKGHDAIRAALERRGSA